MELSRIRYVGKSHREQPGIKEQGKSGAEGQPFICGIVGRPCQPPAHQTVHTRTRSFECFECGQTFHWVSNLLRHQRNHTSEKPSCCEVRGQAFSLKDRRAQHRKIHPEHPPYVCSDCGKKAFKQKSNLLRHKLVHTREKPFSADNHGKDFTKENLRHPQQIHSGEKPYTGGELGKSSGGPRASASTRGCTGQRGSMSVNSVRRASATLFQETSESSWARRSIQVPVGSWVFPVLGCGEGCSRCSQAGATYMVLEPAISTLRKALRKFCQETDTKKGLEAVLSQPV